MIIVCTTEELSGETMDVDRETDLWFERDFDIEGKYAVMIFPKTCWKAVETIVIPIT